MAPPMTSLMDIRMNSKTFMIFLALFVFLCVLLTRLTRLFDTDFMGYDPEYISLRGSLAEIKAQSGETNSSGRSYLTMCPSNVSNTVMSSPMYSRLELVENKETIVVKITTFDTMNTPQKRGGDIILLWATSVKNDRVAGRVVDHGNGTYTGYLNVFWTHRTVVKAKLASTLESACLKENSRIVYGNNVFVVKTQEAIHGNFRKGDKEMLTRCGANQHIHGASELCDFTKLNGDTSWFCVRPTDSVFNCADIYSFKIKGFDLPKDIKASHIIKNDVHGVLKQTITLDSVHKTMVGKLQKCSKRPKLNSWIEPMPSGYWSNSIWNFVDCEGLKEQTVAKYKECLNNKTLMFFGDSTTRQYAQYLITSVLQLDAIIPFNSSGEGWTYHSRKKYIRNNISVIYMKHEMPLHNKEVPAKGITSVADEVLSLAEDPSSDDSMVLMFTYYAHLLAFPVDEFRKRIHSLAKALKHLLIAKPKVTIIYKGSHLTHGRWFDPHLALHYNDIVFQEFHDVRDRVIFADIWSITTAHDSEDIHPANDAFKSQIHQFMSYICDY